MSDEDLQKKSTRVSALIRIIDAKADLSKNLKSLSNQILDDLEILFLVTDDSDSDNTINIIKDYAKKDPRIKLVRTKTTDYGLIMNRAIKLASGEYLTIIDANDYVDPEMFIELFALAKKHDADIVRSNYFESVEEQDRLHESFLKEDADKVINPAEDYTVFYQPPIIGSGLYKREYLLTEKISYIEDFGQDPQDNGFNFKVIAAAEKLVITEKAYLHHVEKKKKQIEKKAVFRINDQYADIEKFLKSHNKWNQYSSIFEANKFASFFLTMLCLDEEDLTPFILRTRAEFHDADERGLLSKKYFPKDHWKYLQSILKFPPRIFLSSLKKIRKRH